MTTVAGEKKGRSPEISANPSAASASYGGAILAFGATRPAQAYSPAAGPIHSASLGVYFALATEVIAVSCGVAQ